MIIYVYSIYIYILLLYIMFRTWPQIPPLRDLPKEEPLRTFQELFEGLPEATCARISTGPWIHVGYSMVAMRIPCFSMFQYVLTCFNMT